MVTEVVGQAREVMGMGAAETALVARWKGTATSAVAAATAEADWVKEAEVAMQRWGVVRAKEVVEMATEVEERASETVRAVGEQEEAATAVEEVETVLVGKEAAMAVVGKEPVAEVRATGASVKGKGRGQPEAEAKGAAAAAGEASAGVVGVEMEGLAGKQGPDLAPPSQSRRAGRPGLGWQSVRQPAP